MKPQNSHAQIVVKSQSGDARNVESSDGSTNVQNAASKDLKHISWIFCFQKNIMLSVQQRIRKNFNAPTTFFEKSQP